jgi:RNA polymerase sigma factor (sigma-70 family)
MPKWPATRVTLLERIRDGGDQKAWAEFVALYGPLVYAFARKRLPQDEDAADVMQEVLSAIAKGKYDRQKGLFHKWVLTVSLNQIRDFFARRGHIEISGAANLEEVPAKVADEWERQHNQWLFDRAAELVRHDTNPTLWQAFWLTAVEEKSGKEAASALGLTVANVFSAKSRIMMQIREMVAQLQAE